MKSRLNILVSILYAALVLLLLVICESILKVKGQVLFVFLTVSVVILLLIHALIHWMKEEIIMPVRELKTAIREVRSGNLKYILDMDASNEIGETCMEFEQLRMQLLEDSENRQQFERESKDLISNISHDLKTPLTAIKGYSEGILDGIVTSPEKKEKYIKTIYSKANDMALLIDELTYYSRIDTNRIPYNFEILRVTDFFGDCVEDTKLDLESRDIAFDYVENVSPEVRIIADPEQLKRVHHNLLSNAIKSIDKSDGIIRMACVDEGDAVRLDMIDNGKGIDATELPFLFDRFYRTDASRNSKTGGSGIGLSICKKIVEDHGGRIWAVSTPGKGSTFCVMLRKYEGQDYEQNTNH